MKRAAFLLAMLLAAGCAPDESYKLVRERVGGCDYVLAVRRETPWALVHAGDCGNAVHKDYRAENMANHIKTITGAKVALFTMRGDSTWFQGER